MSASEYSVTEARYSRGNFIVHCPSSDGMKTRAARLIGDGLNCRWVGRGKGYVASPNKVAKFEALYAAGFNACPMTGEIYHTERGLEGLSVVAALAKIRP